MQKIAVGIVITLLALVGIAGIIVATNMNDNASNQAETAADASDSTDTEASDTPAQQEEASNAAGGTQPSQNQNAATEIDIRDYAFTPEKVTIKKGTTVTWTNQDSVRHDVNPDKETAFFQTSKLLAKGESYSATFTETGTYTYICSPHPYMKGTIEVVE